ncbi:MAG: PTS lactose/cellobiose transporter subunit IIA [Lactobacillus sp.]|nr:PTS lactose/cellobiose transporter subunit IIA [Lactobacillus sp.]
MESAEIESIAFDVISNAGAAKTILMKIISDSEAGDFADIDNQLKEANKLLKEAAQAHFKVITAEAQQKGPGFSLLLVHAEDQLMATESIRDLAQNFIKINRRLYQLESKQNSKGRD